MRECIVLDIVDNNLVQWDKLVHFTSSLQLLELIEGWDIN